MATNVFAPNWEDILIKQLDTKLTALPQPTTPPVQP